MSNPNDRAVRAAALRARQEDEEMSALLAEGLLNRGATPESVRRQPGGRSIADSMERQLGYEAMIRQQLEVTSNRPWAAVHRAVVGDVP